MPDNTPKTRRQWIYDILKTANSISYSECFEKYYNEFQKSQTAFTADWNAAKKKYDEYCEKLNSVKDKKSINKAIEALEKGLKSKIERQLDLQNEIIDLQTRLLDGTTKEKYVKNDGSEAEFERGLTPTEIANYKKVIVMLNAELSKMAGEYAAAKTENRNVDKNGDDVADPIAKAVALGLVTIK